MIRRLLMMTVLVSVAGSLFANGPSLQGVDFYRTPLVCGAAPEIGCGSRAKPLLIALEKHSAIESAWLDRKGNYVAIVWKDEGLGRKQRDKAVKDAFARNTIPLDLVTDVNEQTQLFDEFNGGGAWYRGAQVDELSREEAGVITANILGQLRDEKLLAPDREEDLRKELMSFFEEELVQLRTRDELFSKELQDRWHADLRVIGERYVGAGNMPELRIRSSAVKGCETDGKKNCCKGKESCKH